MRKRHSSRSCLARENWSHESVLRGLTWKLTSREITGVLGKAKRVMLYCGRPNTCQTVDTWVTEHKKPRCWSHHPLQKKPTKKPNKSPACWSGVQKKNNYWWHLGLKVLPWKNQLNLRETSFRSQTDQIQKESRFLNTYKEILKYNLHGLW